MDPFVSSSSGDAFDSQGFNDFLNAGSSSEEETFARRSRPWENMKRSDNFTPSSFGGDPYGFDLDLNGIKIPKKEEPKPRAQKSALKDASKSQLTKKGVSFSKARTKSPEDDDKPLSKEPEPPKIYQPASKFSEMQKNLMSMVSSYKDSSYSDSDMSHSKGTESKSERSDYTDRSSSALSSARPKITNWADVKESMLDPEELEELSQSHNEAIKDIKTEPFKVKANPISLSKKFFDQNIESSMSESLPPVNKKEEIKSYELKYRADESISESYPSKYSGKSEQSKQSYSEDKFEDSDYSQSQSQSQYLTDSQSQNYTESYASSRGTSSRERKEAYEVHNQYYQKLLLDRKAQEDSLKLAKAENEKLKQTNPSQAPSKSDTSFRQQEKPQVPAKSDTIYNKPTTPQLTSIIDSSYRQPDKIQGPQAPGFSFSHDKFEDHHITHANHNSQYTQNTQNRGVVIFSQEPINEVLNREYQIHKDQIEVLTNRISQLEKIIVEKQDQIYNLEKQLLLKQYSKSEEDILEKLQKQLREANHKTELYKIEIEEILKQVDFSEARNRDLEAEIQSLKNEIDRRAQFAEERVRMSETRSEERVNKELMRQFTIEKEELLSKLALIQKDLDFYKTKAEKSEEESKELKNRLKSKRDQDDRVKQLEGTVFQLEAKLKEREGIQGRDFSYSGAPKEWSKEFEAQEQLIKGYQKENERLVEEMKKLKNAMQEEQLKVHEENRKIASLKFNEERVNKELVRQFGMEKEELMLKIANLEEDIEQYKKQVENLENELKEHRIRLKVKREKEAESNAVPFFTADAQAEDSKPINIPISNQPFESSSSFRKSCDIKQVSIIEEKPKSVLIPEEAKGKARYTSKDRTLRASNDLNRSLTKLPGSLSEEKLKKEMLDHFALDKEKIFSKINLLEKDIEFYKKRSEMYESEVKDLKLILMSKKEHDIDTFQRLQKLQEDTVPSKTFEMAPDTFYKKKAENLQDEVNTLVRSRRELEERIQDLLKTNYQLEVRIKGIEELRDLTPKEWVKRYEAQEQLVKGYQKENERLGEEVKKLRSCLEDEQVKVYQKNKQIGDFSSEMGMLLMELERLKKRK
jgi:hypothetical protein